MEVDFLQQDNASLSTTLSNVETNDVHAVNDEVDNLINKITDLFSNLILDSSVCSASKTIPLSGTTILSMMLIFLMLVLFLPLLFN